MLMIFQKSPSSCQWRELIQNRSYDIGVKVSGVDSRKTIQRHRTVAVVTKYTARLLA